MLKVYKFDVYNNAEDFLETVEIISSNRWQAKQILLGQIKYPLFSVAILLSTRPYVIEEN